MADLKLMDLGEWNTQEIAKLPLFEEFPAVITESRIVPVGRQHEQSLELTFEAVGGSRKGQRFTRYVTVWSPDADERQCGRNLLHALCRALGMDPPPTDSAEMHGRLVVVQLVRERGEQDRPYVQCAHCSRPAYEETKRWMTSEGKAFSERMASHAVKGHTNTLANCEAEAVTDKTQSGNGFDGAEWRGRMRRALKEFNAKARRAMRKPEGGK